MISPWDRWVSTSCCLCCHVRTGTIILGVWYMLINAVVLLVLLLALGDPEQYHLTCTNLSNDPDITDDANVCIAAAISLLMIFVCGMATYGASKQHATWIIPFFCYQLFDLVMNTLVAASVAVYPGTVQDYVRHLPENFPYKEEILSVNRVCLAIIVLLFIGCILAFKVSWTESVLGIIYTTGFLHLGLTVSFRAYLLACVWNCYKYVSGRRNTEVLVYVTTNDTTVLLPPYDEAMSASPKQPPPPYTPA